MVTHPEKRSGVALNQALELASGILPSEFESWDEVPNNYQSFRPNLMPTPTVSDQYTGSLSSTQQSEGSMHSVTLAQVVNRSDLMPTPTVVDLGNNKTPEQWAEWKEAQRLKHGNGNGHGESLAQVFLPTPSTMDHLPARTPEKLAESKERSPAGYSNLREKVVNDLLPTPQVDDSKNTGHNENRGKTLASKVYGQTEWGRFTEAIERWEQVNGPAPKPTEPYGEDGKHRLSARFAEWMMGLQPGHVTDCDITRNEQLKACGNGVVPQQAALALKLLGAKNVVQDN
jgi:DNA (cytosine-5)-methyltransferase 1